MSARAGLHSSRRVFAGVRARGASRKRRGPTWPARARVAKAPDKIAGSGNPAELTKASYGVREGWPVLRSDTRDEVFSGEANGNRSPCVRDRAGRLTAKWCPEACQRSFGGLPDRVFIAPLHAMFSVSVESRGRPASPLARPPASRSSEHPPAESPAMAPAQ